MAVSIISCPSCDAMLLEDTVQCPTCQHVLKPDEFVASGLSEMETVAGGSVAAGETSCPACGEGVRNGLVRCWNCGTFMNAAVQETFSQLQATSGRHANPVLTYSTGGDADIPLAPEPADDFPDAVSQAHDEDFEVSPEFELRMPSVTLGNYNLTWQNAVSDEAQSDAPTAEADSYQLVRPAEPETPAAPPEPVSEKPSAKPAPPDAGRTPPPEDEVSHSEATAGDVLLEIALTEEKQASSKKQRVPKKRAASAKTRTGVLVFCPKGHRIEVQDKHRGMLGRCPKCKLPFFVPIADEKTSPATPEVTTAATATAVPAAANAGNAVAASADSATPVFGAAVSTGTLWMLDLPLHSVNPAKVKAKPGCLAKSFQPVDVAFRPEGLLVVTLGKAGGVFGIGGKKPDALRQAVQQHLTEGKPVAELPASSKLELAPDALASLKIVQPAVYPHECPFGDVPVFGDGRIAVQLPTPADVPERQFLSFSLSKFREFVQQIRGRYGLASFGENAGVPLVDSYTDEICHYTDSKIAGLNDAGFYAADPAFPLDVIGRKCAGCGLIVSEDARKKEKIGGLDGKGIAKAKCPKCGAKFGNISLYAIKRS